MNVVILVPRRPDNGPRDRLWAWCKPRWERFHPDWPIFEGASPPGPFNRSAALNDAARQAGDWDVALLIDADVVANPTAVHDAVDIAANAGRVVVAHNDRVMLNKAGTDKVLAGYDGPWRLRQMVETVYSGPESCHSCAVAVPRTVWDHIGGFDERFAGWGFEDSAFAIAVATLARPFVNLAAETFHLWHPLAEGADKKSPTHQANAARLERYRTAAGDREAIMALLDEPAELPPVRIARILHRTVPETTSDEIESWWAKARTLHPGWELRTYREPIDPKDWPLTGDLFARCQNGAQKAGLIRLEALVTHGGVYLDSDVEPFRSLEPLLHVPAFAAWEDETTVPDAVLGAEANHPAFLEAIAKARSVIEGGGDAWQSGPGVTTELLPGRVDVLVLPPGAFYPHHYLEKHAAGTRTASPWVFVEHKWHHSWGSPQSKRSIEQRQRR